ncbi:MAG: M48 family metalloprotease [Desulfobacterales bacterium]|jgi:Zn-dependent protease with chaperone function
MFSNFIYFIIVLLIYATYQPAVETNFTPIDTALLFAALHVLFITYNRSLFQRLQHRVTRESFTRLDNRFNNLLTRQSILSIALFAIDIYGLSLPSFFISLPLFSIMPTLLALVFLALFVSYLAVVWGFAFDAHRRLYGSDISRSAYVWSQISFSVPVLLPWLVLSAITDLINALPFEWLKNQLATTTGSVVYFMFFLVIVAVIGPAMIQKFWRCRPLEDSTMRQRIEALCKKANLEYANILYWPIFGGRMITAGVMGLIKKFRYILVTSALLSSLQPAEIDAVIAHEIGHVKRYHLVFYLVFFAGFMVLTYATYDLIFYAVIYTEPMFQFFSRFGFNPVTLTSVFLSVNMVVIFLIYFRFIFGYFMRNFERQADGYVYTLFDTAQPLISTLEKIAYTSGQSPDRPNWHHFSISERISHLARCEIDRSTIDRHDRKVRNSILVFVASMVLVAAVGYGLNFGETGRQLSSHFFEKIILREIEKHPQNPNLYKVLGDLYYETGNLSGVQQAYEASLKLNPENPHVLNNLAWLYATAEDPRFRNPARALDLAKAAADLLEEPHILDTLAVCYYANGQYAKALETARRALRLARENRTYYQEQVEKFRKAAGPSA